MVITDAQKQSIPFQYAYDVLDGRIVTGKRIRQAVERFFRWIDEADDKGYYLDHDAGMQIINFFPFFLRHTVGAIAGQSFHLASFQQFTMYQAFAWKKKSDGLRRIRTVYDKRGKKNGKTAEMAGLAMFCISLDGEMGAQVFIGATKEDQARLCWNQASDFINSPVAHPGLAVNGFYSQQKVVGFKPTRSKIMPLGGDSKTHDGINAHVAIIDEYHAHPDNSVKDNLKSSSVNRLQPLLWHITTAGTNVQSVCKNFEDSCIEVLEGRHELDTALIMIHDLDEGDDWQDEKNWIKANPLLGQGLDISRLREEYENALVHLSEIPNFKTKHLNMWVDAPQVWIPNETWMAGARAPHEFPIGKFAELGSYAGTDLSSTRDLSAWVVVSEPDAKGYRYLKGFFFCPQATIDKRSKEDRVPYRYWADNGYLIATPGDVIDYAIIKDVIRSQWKKLGVIRNEIDRFNATQLTTELNEEGYDTVLFSQGIMSISAPTKEFEKLVVDGKMIHDGNPVMSWFLASCVIYRDANENIKVHKGNSGKNGRRVDGVVGAIMALGGSMSPEEDNGKYSKDQPDIYV